MIVCPQCGKETVSNSRYCASCGCAAPKVEPPTTDDATNPYAVETQSSDSPMPSDVEPRDVPSGMVAALKMCFKERSLKDRSSRAEFWLFIAWDFFTVFLPVFIILAPAIDSYPSDEGLLIAWTALVWGIVLAVPSFGVTVRRFHDVNLPGIPAYILLLEIALFSLICFSFRYYNLTLKYVSDFVRTIIVVVFPLVAGICLLAILIVALIPGTKCDNNYGPPPRKREATTEDKTHDSEVSP